MEFEDASVKTEEFVEAVKGKKKKEYAEQEGVADLFG